MLTFTAEQVREIVPIQAAIDAVKSAFIDFRAGEFEMPIRTSLRDGQFLIMSAHHRGSASMMVKTLSLNFSRIPAIVGTVAWSDLSGGAQVVADASAVTMLRTGAVTGVATDLMASIDATALTLIGAGAQGADQVRSVCAVRAIRSLIIVDIELRRARGLANLLQSEMSGLDIDVSTDADTAVSSADIVCCATTATQALFKASSLPDRVHVNAVGAFRPSMRELPDELLAAASHVVVDEMEAALQESGEVIGAVESGAITESRLLELGEALTTPPPWGDVTVFKSVGVAIQDWAIARLLANHEPSH